MEDAHGAPPTIPFWLGEAPGRSDELSASVSRLRAEVEERIGIVRKVKARCGGWEEVGIDPAAARSSSTICAPRAAALGCLPTQDTLVFERFFDEAGGMQLVIHSPYGSRINRAWGLALRKRFCRKFNFELQAAATEDNIVLSLTTAHSFELADVARYLHSASVKSLLIQALLDAPMFATRWRWVAGVSLALPRFRGGKKVPPQLTRMAAEDLIGTVFPDQLACAENLVGEREVPDHPLVNQTIADCLNEAMDIDGLERLLTGLESGSIRVIARDLTQPSPLAQEVLTARPYAYLDDAPLEERRTQAVMSRRWLDPETASELGQLDADAITRVRDEAWPDPANADELHDALVWLGVLTEAEVSSRVNWSEWLGELADTRRVTRCSTPGASFWVAAERLPHVQALWPDVALDPAITPPASAEPCETPEQGLVELVRGRLEGQGPLTPTELATTLGLEAERILTALAALESEGFALSGCFRPGVSTQEWCERRLLARIHRYTVKRLRAEIEPVAARDYTRFLFEWQQVTPDSRMDGPLAVPEIVEQLAGFEAPAAAWEKEILPTRLIDYSPAWLDERCLAGRVAWTRLRPCNARINGNARRPGPIKSTPITLLARKNLQLWASISGKAVPVDPSSSAQTIADYIQQHGASFFDEMAAGTGLLRCQVEDGLAELVALGMVNSDSFGGLRALLVPSEQRRPIAGARRRRRTVTFGMENSGRWALARRLHEPQNDAGAVEHVARNLLGRYGVVFWRLLEREAAWLPPWRDLLRIYRKLESRGEIRGRTFCGRLHG